MGASYRIIFLGKRPVARVSAHPPTFIAELQVPMGAYPEEYSIFIAIVYYIHYTAVE